MLALVTPNAPAVNEVTYECRPCKVIEKILIKR